MQPDRPSTPDPAPLVAFGQVRHARLRPARHAFAYANYFWLLPLRALARQEVPAVRRNRWGLLSFHDADHGVGGPDALAWIDATLREAGVDMAGLDRGEVWLQTFPRVLGFAFKPVSFWWVHREDRSLAAVVAEVNSTFGERHAYVLDGPSLKLGREVKARKLMHVSPFCAVTGQYRFRFMRTGPWGQAHPPGSQAADRVLVCVDHDDEHGPLLQTSQGGTLHPLNAATVRRAFWGMPLMTFGVVWRIHWQALRVWLKGVPLHTKPEHPPAHLSRIHHEHPHP